MTPAHLDPDVFARYLERTRWFGGKGRSFSVTDVHPIGEVAGRVEDSPWVVVHLVEVTYTDVAPDTGAAEAATEHYQVPLALYTDAETRLDHAFLGWWEDPDRGWVHAYDALHDRAAMACWLRSFGEDATPSDTLDFRRLRGHDLDLEAGSTLFTGEQSNSSVAFGEDSLMKVFRKVTAGPNPDITVHRALTQAGSDDVAALYGWVETRDPESGEVIQLAMLQQFLRTATDGWDLALASVRTLLAEPDVAARESGGDFVGEAERLGLTLREVHQLLRQSFDTATASTAEIADQMRDRLDRAVQAAPDLAPHAEAVAALYERFAAIGDVPVQAVHGDLHLGQTLRTAQGWKIVDFEGEPAKTLAERLVPDSPWRDVAGMLRSFDYAPPAVEQQLAPGDDDADQAQRAEAAAAWTERNQRYFLTAYAGGELTDEQRTMLDAYVADKAVYETVYETRNRPDWVAIPLQAVARIGAA